MTVKLSRDPGTTIKYPSLHSFIERSRDPGTITTVIIIFIVEEIYSLSSHQPTLSICKKTFVQFHVLFWDSRNPYTDNVQVEPLLLSRLVGGFPSQNPRSS